MKKNTKKSLIKNGIFGLAILLLFLTGAHTEVIAFVQRGMLKTGLMDPKVEALIEAYDATETEGTKVAPGTKADFNLQLVDINGAGVSMEQFRGKAIFINVWATWCPPCIAEMPGINELYKDLKDENVEFIMLSMDEDFNKAIDFQKKKDYDFNIYSLAAPLPQMYSSRAIPTTFVIDANGHLALTHKGIGDFNTEEFRDFLNKIQ